MKRIAMISAFAMLVLASCKNDKETTPETAPVVENPAPEPTPQTSSTTTTTTTTTTNEDPDGTSVSIDKNGFSLESKNGSDENNVTVTKKEVTVEKKTE